MLHRQLERCTYSNKLALYGRYFKKMRQHAQRQVQMRREQRLADMNDYQKRHFGKNVEAYYHRMDEIRIKRERREARQRRAHLSERERRLQEAYARGGLHSEERRDGSITAEEGLKLAAATARGSRGISCSSPSFATLSVAQCRL